MPSDEHETPTPRSHRPATAILFVGMLLVAIFFVSRGCQSQGIELSQAEAIAIARQHVSFKPDLEIVRFVRRGVQFKPHWAVSLSRKSASGGRTGVTVVIVDAETGEVVAVHRDQ